MAWQTAAIQPAHLPQNLLDRIHRRLGQVNGRRIHFHHPPTGHVGRQSQYVVHVRVAHEPRGRAHERPRLASQIKANLELRDPPIGLHCRSGIALDREILVRHAAHRLIVQFQFGAGPIQPTFLVAAFRAASAALSVFFTQFRNSIIPRLTIRPSSCRALGRTCPPAQLDETGRRLPRLNEPARLPDPILPYSAWEGS